MGRKTKNTQEYAALDHVDEAGLRVYIRPRADSKNLQMVTYDMEVSPKTAGTDDLDEARKRARQWARTLVRDMPDGFSGTITEKWLLYGDESLTFGDAFRLWEELEYPTLKDRYASCRYSDLQALTALIDPDLPVHEWRKKNVVEYVRARRRGGFITTGEAGNEAVRGGVEDSTIFDDLNLLGRCVEVLREQLRDGARRPFPGGNPVWGTKKEGTRKKYWPVKRTGGRTLIAPDRLQAMLEHCEEQEAANRVRDHMPPGYLRALLLMMRWDGRRFGAHQALRIGDVLLSPRAAKQALRRSDLDVPIPETWADHWPYGAVQFVADLEMEHRGKTVSIGDKMNRGFLVPMSKRQNSFLQGFLATHPQRDNPSAPLFPNGKDPMQPVTYDEANRWWRALERRAGLVHRKNQVFHTLRHLRRSELKGMPEELVQIVCSWAVDDFKTMNAVYLHYEPDEIYACVEMDPEVDGRNAGLRAVMKRLNLLREPRAELLSRLLERLSEEELEELLQQSEEERPIRLVR